MSFTQGVLEIHECFVPLSYVADTRARLPLVGLYFGSLAVFEVCESSRHGVSQRPNRGWLDRRCSQY